MRLTRLRVAGFKSFVDATEVAIQPGLTGLVGPNGCGKSNLVEAMRWAMGEGSARQLRGSEMDDVIFGGTDRRPPRSVAEVTITVEARPGEAPAPFQDQTQLDISRRIDRGDGSTYRINGREVRARDVAVLFADAGSGAQSPSLVGQGRIARLIAAKPADRRAVLEDAAGIAGLQGRRHEAELRLRAAEANLTRVEDVRQGLEKQRQALVRQARQAERYRDLGSRIRQAEAVVIALAWHAAVADRAAAGERLRLAEAAVVAATGAAASAVAAQADAAAGLPALRNAREAASAEEARIAVALAETEAERRRIADRLTALAQTKAQVEADRLLADRARADAQAALDRLTDEASGLETLAAGEADARCAAEQALADATRTVAEAESAADALRRDLAIAEAEVAQIARAAAEIARRRDRLTQERAQWTARVEALARERAALPDATHAAAEVAAADARLVTVRADLDGHRADRAAAVTRQSQARAREAERRAVLDGLAAEARGLDAVLAASDAAGGKDAGLSVADSARADPGFEAALAAALGEGASAHLSDAAKGPRWLSLPTLAAAELPAEAEPLAGHWAGVAVLARRLDRVGVVADAATAARLQPGLAPGMLLVTRDGEAWGWDGLVRPAHAAGATAVRLRQLNRRAALEAELTPARAEHATAAAARAAVDAEVAALDTAIAATDRAEREALALAARARDAANRATAAAAALTGRQAALDESQAGLDRTADDLATLDHELTDRRASMPDPAPLAARVEAAGATLRHARAVADTARAALDRLAREVDLRRQRRVAIGEETARWINRQGDLTGQAEALDARAVAADREARSLADQPAHLERTRAGLLTAQQAARAHVATTADRLATAEATAAEADRAARRAEAEVARVRETQVRAEAEVAQAQTAAGAVADRMRERLGCRPAEVDAVAGLDPAVAPDPAVASAAWERLVREREALGPVNLQADGELAGVEAQIATLETERDDLVHAIARLRGAIGALNREGRERLQESFEKVDGHFRQIFETLFGGGSARLELTESEDPLNAGLEIFACPPGKKPQALSLMSGGEQALTALALILAVFLTNPSPICVLDEVDAPLDDANVDRFCDLLRDVAGRTGTRFLVVTHHRLTMARMDRLYGVTMAERGVSRLVSVDLGEAEELREAG